MLPTLAALLGSALLARTALAELTFTVAATRHGVPVPPSEIKLEPFEMGRGRMGRNAIPKGRGNTRRANPTFNSTNWCGSVNHTPSSNPIRLVHGYFQHPTCSQRSGVTTYPQAAAAWVGIDGDTWTSALVQAGTVCEIDNSTGVTTNKAWWQWFPDAAYMITSMPVSPSDWFEITINTTSTTAAEITLTNLNQAQTYTVSVHDGPALGRVDADWVVERPHYGAGLASFAAFTDVWFEQAYATRTISSSSPLGILGATQFQIPAMCASQESDSADLVAWSV